jgi:hypothetical protein
MAIQGFFFSTAAKAGAALVLGAVAGVFLGLQLAQPPSSQLVKPKAPEQTLALALKQQLQPPDLAQAMLAVEQGPMWQLLPSGADLFAPAGAPAGQAAPIALQEWILVGRVSRPDAMGLVLYQKQSKVSRFFKVSDVLPDGRKLVSMNSTGFVLGAVRGKKKEYFEHGAGLMLAEPPAPDPANAPPNPSKPATPAKIPTKL